MAAKILHSMTDDNPNLQKQIGCMTGIFQLFDRQPISTGRRIVGHRSERLPPGNSHFYNDTLETESNTEERRSAPVEKFSNNNIQERQRVSRELSRASSSSSRSSSFSSLDFNQTNQLESMPFDRMIFPETPSRNPAMNMQNSSPQYSRQALDLRDVVKDSMYKEVEGLSVKAETIEEAPDLMVKFKDFPRQLPRIVDGSQDTAKFREAPWYHNEPRELLRSSSYHSKDRSSFSISKDARRFSYDGREISYIPFESQVFPNSTQKLKDFPRLSLDSREGSMRNSNANSKSIFHAKTSHKDSGEFNGEVQSLQQTSGNQARPTSVVAKLMGLENLPDSVVVGDTNSSSRRTYPVEEFVNFSRSSAETDSSNQIQLSTSSKLWKEPSSPRGRNPDSIMRHISRFSIESAPKKLIDMTRLPRKPASRSTRGSVKVPNTFPSVYSEIEKRLKDLEFAHSGKDLRALKQILEAMQAKGLLETQKEGQDYNVTCLNDHEQRYTSSRHDVRTVNNQKLQTDLVLASSQKRADSLRHFESPIIIMKPAKLVQKSDMPAASVISLDGFSGLPKLQSGKFIHNRKDLSSRRAAKDRIFREGNRDNSVNSVNRRTDNRNLKTAHTSERTQQLHRESTPGFRKSSESISPRIQQKKLELGKRSKPPTPPDSIKSRRQSNNQQEELSSPGGLRRAKHPNAHQSNDRLSEGSSNLRNLNFQKNEFSVHSNGGIILGSKKVEVTSFDEISPEIMKSAEFLISGAVEKKPNWMVSEKEQAEARAPLEYPSPVSVLDNNEHTDDLPSPVKQVGMTLKGDEPRILNTMEDILADDFILNSRRSGNTSEINGKKLQDIDNLVQKLRRLNSSHDEAHTDYIASLCENTNPNHRYISEILLASGLLLRDLGSSLTNFQFHPSGHPINPELFLVLEQTKASSLRKEEFSAEKTTQLLTREKSHRKLFFDVVNEILRRKLASIGPLSEPCLRPNKLARKGFNAQKLLKELCSEIEELQMEISKCSFVDEDSGLKRILHEDFMHQSETWISFNGKISGVVQDIERLIFKDLVDEVVVGKVTGLKTKTIRRGQIFAK
ncbi:Hypothetical predicted protein [Olea europaea subsp. europaea]|uniref:DUF4378 domain-containing protein n=1 Tax=Olea europaea subsp. europaea TaxID=158383 RepID=A0A8S0SFL8_OLEEU|nr:Hypothetical predicted protein [Olea europaea subsp. europaea]